MTMLNTDAPGVAVEVTDTVAHGRPSQVRLQAWFQRPDQSFDVLVDLRFTPEQAEDLARALDCFAAAAEHDNTYKEA